MPLSGLKPSRRQLLSGLTASVVASALIPNHVFASAADVTAEIKKLVGEKSPAEGKIKLDVPQIAENGLIVPINVEVESPMTESDFVKAVHVFADGNPLPGVVTYRFTPASGKAAFSLRIRLAQTQNIVCLAEMSNGQIFTAKSEVKVTIGGCGG
jgi:sulfur-oxidizing protein SoxY